MYEAIIFNSCFPITSFLWWLGLVKKVIRLFIRTRKQGSSIDSIPLKQLCKFAECPEKYRRWSFEDGWLILEAF